MKLFCRAFNSYLLIILILVFVFTPTLHACIALVDENGNLVYTNCQPCTSNCQGGLPASCFGDIFTTKGPLICEGEPTVTNGVCEILGIDDGTGPEAVIYVPDDDCPTGFTDPNDPPGTCQSTSCPATLPPDPNIVSQHCFLCSSIGGSPTPTPTPLCILDGNGAPGSECPPVVDPPSGTTPPYFGSLDCAQVTSYRQAGYYPITMAFIQGLLAPGGMYMQALGNAPGTIKFGIPTRQFESVFTTDSAGRVFALISGAGLNEFQLTTLAHSGTLLLPLGTIVEITVEIFGTITAYTGQLDLSTYNINSYWRGLFSPPILATPDPGSGASAPLLPVVENLSCAQPSPSPSGSPSAQPSVSPTSAPSVSSTPTAQPSVSASAQPSVSSSPVVLPSATSTATAQPSASNVPSASSIPSASSSPIVQPSATSTATAQPSASNVPSASSIPSASSSPIVQPSATSTATASASPSSSSSPRPSSSATPAASNSPLPSASPSAELLPEPSISGCENSNINQLQFVDNRFKGVARDIASLVRKQARMLRRDGSARADLRQLFALANEIEILGIVSWQITWNSDLQIYSCPGRLASCVQSHSNGLPQLFANHQTMANVFEQTTKAIVKIKGSKGSILANRTKRLAKSLDGLHSALKGVEKAISTTTTCS